MSKHSTGRDEATIPRGHYLDEGYDSRGRFASYWHQIDEVRQSGAETVLEIGIGNGFVHTYLRNRGIAVVTVDINKDLNPDIVASATDIPVSEGSFDTVLCAEVLEHLEFSEVQDALRELRRVTRGGVIVSVPDRARCYRLHLDVPRLGVKRRIIEAGSSRVTEPMCPDHEWEIGLPGHSLTRFMEALAGADLKVIRTYRVFEMPTWRFIILAVA